MPIKILDWREMKETKKNMFSALLRAKIKYYKLLAKHIAEII